MNPGVYGTNTQFATLPCGLLGRPTPFPMPDQFWHPEALGWRDRAQRNGGVVSPQTLQAVSNFCIAIENAGLRDRLVRLNLFCGSNLSACLVPLYRSTSATGAVVGNATDTNVNFVSADYAETGATGGLKGNGSTKYLNTGVTFASLPVATVSMSAYAVEMETTAASNQNFALIGSLNSSGGFHGAALSAMWNFSTPDRRADFIGSGAALAARYASGFTSRAHVSASNIAQNTYGLFENGVSLATAIGSVGAATNNQAGPILVFCRNTLGTVVAPAVYTSARIRAYHIGGSMSNAQQLAFFNAMHSFQIALGRPI